MKHIHHIIPKHMGGTDDPSNLIELSVEEHAEAHRKLYEEHGKQEDLMAWKMLSGQIGKDEALSMARSIGGKKKMSEESKAKLKESCKKRYERQLADGTWEEANKKRSRSHEGKIRTPDHAKNNVESRKNNGKDWHNDTTKQKISASMKNTPKKKCPYCDKIMGASNLAYHIKRKHES